MAESDFDNYVRVEAEANLLRVELEQANNAVVDLQRKLKHEIECRRSDIRESIFSAHLLPDGVQQKGAKHVELTVQQMRDFNAHYTELGQFIADMLDVPFERLCMADMMFRRDRTTGLEFLLKRALPYLEKLDDEGPEGHGWKSAGLSSLIKIIEKLK